MELSVQPHVTPSTDAETLSIELIAPEETPSRASNLHRKPPERRRLTSGIRAPKKTTNLTLKNGARPSQMQLPFWRDEVRGVPNAILRGALFSISQRRATASKRTLLETVDGIEIRFKGERFNQTDLDVWEMLIHLARHQPLGDRVEFGANAFLKGLGRSDGKAQHEQLKEEITRLRSGTVEIKWKGEGKTFGGGLVSNYFYDDLKKRYVVIFDERMLRLYDSGYTESDWMQRRKLGNNGLAKWLFRFYATHAAPYAYKIETLSKLCGSTSKSLGDFRKLLRPALQKLIDIDAIKSWSIDTSDKLTVRKTPTMSQKRHLQKREAAKNAAEFDFHAAK